MADEQMDKIDINLKPSLQGGLGLRLRAAREARGLSREQVASKLRLSLQWIIDMESDDYRRAPALVYVRGNVRAYAKFLGLPEAAIVAELEQMDLEEKAVLRQAPAVFKQMPVKRYSSLIWLITAVLVMALLVLIVDKAYQYVQNKKDTTTVAEASTSSSDDSSTTIVPLNTSPVTVEPVSSTNADQAAIKAELRNKIKRTKLNRDNIHD